jgi:aryl-alcohol dehydrogenase-like predicted oxidoreductase
MPARYDMSNPDNQRKLDAADALGQLADDAGLPLIHLAIAFVMQHPAVTAPIIGPRTFDHLKSQIGAADVTLSAEILDKIDEIVPPGSTITRTDQGYLPPSVTNPFLRRRRSA